MRYTLRGAVVDQFIKFLPFPVLLPVAENDERADTPSVRSFAAALSVCIVTMATPSPSCTVNMLLAKETVTTSLSSMMTIAPLAVRETWRPVE